MNIHNSISGLLPLSHFSTQLNTICQLFPWSVITIESVSKVTFLCNMYLLFRNLNNVGTIREISRRKMFSTMIWRLVPVRNTVICPFFPLSLIKCNYRLSFYICVAREKGDDYQMQNKEKLVTIVGTAPHHFPQSPICDIFLTILSCSTIHCIAAANNLINKLSDAHKTTLRESLFII